MNFPFTPRRTCHSMQHLCVRARSEKWRLGGGGGGVARCVVRVEDAHRVQNIAATSRRRHIRMCTCGKDLVAAQPRLGNRDIDKLGIRTNAGLCFHEGLRVREATYLQVRAMHHDVCRSGQIG